MIFIVMTTNGLAFGGENQKSTLVKSSRKQSAKTSKEAQTKALETKLLLLTHEYIKQMLKDPESAKFRNELVDGYIVIGEFDAKNSYGGYGGYESYSCIVDGEKVSGGFFIPKDTGGSWTDKYSNAFAKIRFQASVDSIRMKILMKKSSNK